MKFPIGLLLLCGVDAHRAAPMRLVDARLHCSQHAWAVLSPDVAANIAYRNAESLLAQ